VLPVQVFKKKIRMERQQRMADANRPHPIAHDISDATAMIILTPDQRSALTGLLVKASAVGMSMAVMFDRQHDIEAVWLRNLFQ